MKVTISEPEPLPDPLPMPPVDPAPEIKPPPDGTPVPGNPFDILMNYLQNNFEVINKRLDQQGTAIVEIGNKVFAAGPNVQPVGAESPLDQWGKRLDTIIGMAKQGLGGSSSSVDDVYKRIGQQVFDKTLESTVKRVVGTVASDSAKHVSG